MKVIKYNNALKGKNSDKCKTLEYSFMDKDIDLGIAIISGRYPDDGYGVNLISKELIYVIEGSGTINFENEKIEEMAKKLKEKCKCKYVLTTLGVIEYGY